MLKNDNFMSEANAHDQLLRLVYKNENIEKQMQALVGTFKSYSEQNNKLTTLYENTKLKNQELIRINFRITKDIEFLKEYCTILEQELENQGYYNCTRQDMLTRKQTVKGIFQAYNQSTLSLEEDTEFNSNQLQLRNCILNLQNENRLLKQQLQTQIHQTLAQSSQITLEPEKSDIWHKAYQISQERVTRLEMELKDLRKLNDSLEMDRERRGVGNFIMKDRQQLFNNIHTLINEYKKKIKELGHEKKEVEKRYKNLKQKVSRLDENSEYKLIQLYTEKIQVLQRLTEKQQGEIEKIIDLYEVQLDKIEERRREEITMFENEKMDLETDNLKMCIDLQKSLNQRDDMALQLIQQKNKHENLLLEIAQLRQDHQSRNYQEKSHPSLELISKNISVVLESQPAFENTLINKEKVCQVKDKITITYGHHHLIPTYGRSSINTSLNVGNLNKSYDSVIQYKKRFIERKPQASSNQ